SICACTAASSPGSSIALAPSRLAEGPKPSLRAHEFLHRLAAGEFVDELVEIADFAHERVFDLFDADAADHALNQRARRVEGRGVGEEGLEIRSRFQDGLKLRGAGARSE